jgi:hypothetical protein
MVRRMFAPQPASELRLYRVTNRTRQSELASRGEVASHGATRRKGLLGRMGLGAGEGLWIVPCEAVHTFGMKFAIDLVYLDRRNRVVKTRSAVVPGRISACLSAHSVLELPPGTVCATETRRGDEIEMAAVADACA